MGGGGGDAGGSAGDGGGEGGGGNGDGETGGGGGGGRGRWYAPHSRASCSEEVATREKRIAGAGVIGTRPTDRRTASLRKKFRKRKPAHSEQYPTKLYKH